MATPGRHGGVTMAGAGRPGVILFNPWATSRPRVPNSILHLAAALGPDFDVELVDGNREADPWVTIRDLLRTGRFRYFGCTVMPGPQLRQAVPVTRQVREAFPGIVTIWGGYFPSNQPEAVLRSPWVDHVIDGPADTSFRHLLETLEAGEPVDKVPGAILLHGDTLVRVPRGPIPSPDDMPPLPLALLSRRYPMAGYLPHTFLGRRTHAMHTSFGCPFTCSFCAVVPIYQGRWKPRAAERVARDVLGVRDQYGVDAIEFTDNNFFVSEKRVAEFARHLLGQGVSWWGEGRIDTIDRYADETLALMRAAGCRMIFFGAESGDDTILAQIDKGGKQSGQQMLRFARRLLSFGIIPEYSFVLGFPKPTAAEVWAQIHRDIAFIRDLKRQAPGTEIILYIYSPVPTEGSALHEQITRAGFAFPRTLEEWLSPAWESFDLHRNPLTPWLTPSMVRHIHDFETVLNARYPTGTDFTVGPLARRLMPALASLRYRLRLYRRPLELKAFLKLLRYTRPEIEGFRAEGTTTP